MKEQGQIRFFITFQSINYYSTPRTQHLPCFSWMLDGLKDTCKTQDLARNLVLRGIQDTYQSIHMSVAISSITTTTTTTINNSYRVE